MYLLKRKALKITREIESGEKIEVLWFIKKGLTWTPDDCCVEYDLYYEILFSSIYTRVDKKTMKITCRFCYENDFSVDDKFVKAEIVIYNPMQYKISEDKNMEVSNYISCLEKAIQNGEKEIIICWGKLSREKYKDIKKIINALELAGYKSDEYLDKWTLPDLI